MTYLLKIIQQFLTIFGFSLTRSMAGLSRDRKINLYSKGDYVRIATLELVGFEIINKQLKGNIAELGVYKGEFSAYLNKLFPNKKLYLFDTFEGFDRRDVDRENRKYKSKFNDFSDTSEQLVLKKMATPDNCVFKKGYFPASLNGLEDEFCFVSLDADLFDPIYEGLIYFYPRLVKGGYIFIHDFNNDNYPGAKDAVLRYCNEKMINFTPICDGWGTAIITK